MYSYGPPSDILVNDGLNIGQWSHKIVTELKNSYHLVAS